MVRKSIKTTHQRIVIAHSEYLLHNLPNLENTSDYENTCWACGLALGKKAIRCHIIPHCKKGVDSPDNFFLLCVLCHDEQPDNGSYASQLHWLRTRENWLARATRLSQELIQTLLDEFGKDVLQRYEQERSIIDDFRTGWMNGASWAFASGRANAYYHIRSQMAKIKHAS